MIVQHTAATFLQKTFSDGIDADEKLNDPKEAIPNPVVGAFNHIVQHKNCCADIQQHTIECILLADFEQQVFFKKREYVFESGNFSCKNTANVAAANPYDYYCANKIKT